MKYVICYYYLELIYLRLASEIDKFRVMKYDDKGLISMRFGKDYQSSMYWREEDYELKNNEVLEMNNWYVLREDKLNYNSFEVCYNVTKKKWYI